MKKPTIGKWGRNIFVFGIYFLLVFYQDAIQKVPLFNEILFVLIIISLAIFLKQLYNENNKIKSGEVIKIKKQLDNLNLILSIILGILMLGFVYSANDMKLLEKINYAIIGLILIISGITNRKSLTLSKSNNSNIEVLELDIKINSADKSLAFSTFQITLKKANGQTEHLNELILNFNDAKHITNWLNSGLSNSSIRYFWQIEDKMEEIKTDTNKVQNGNTP